MEAADQLLGERLWLTAPGPLRCECHVDVEPCGAPNPSTLGFRPSGFLPLARQAQLEVIVVALLIAIAG